MLDHTPLVGKITQPINRAEVSSSIQFTPERIVAAIAYHLIDEGIATSLAPESTKRTLNRLRQQSFSFSISSRRALNSEPGFHSGYSESVATLNPTWKSSRASSAAPDRSQSDLISSETL